ncbi:hypothetical protein P3S68_011637 [Capsicum galapagoense]
MNKGECEINNNGFFFSVTILYLLLRFFGTSSINHRSVTSSTIHSRASHMLSYQPSTFRNFSTSDVIRGKGHGVPRGTFNQVIKRFEKEEMSGDVKKLKELYGSFELVDNLSENVCSRVCKLIRGNIWGDNCGSFEGCNGCF